MKKRPRHSVKRVEAKHSAAAFSRACEENASGGVRGLYGRREVEGYFTARGSCAAAHGHALGGLLVDVVFAI